MTQPMQCSAGEAAIRELRRRVEALESILVEEEAEEHHCGCLPSYGTTPDAELAYRERDEALAQVVHLQAMLDDRGPDHAAEAEKAKQLLMSTLGNRGSTTLEKQAALACGHIANLEKWVENERNRGSLLIEKRDELRSRLEAAEAQVAHLQTLLEDRGDKTTRPDLRATMLRILDAPAGAWPLASEEHLLGAIAGLMTELRQTVDKQALELASLRVRLAGIDKETTK